MRLGEDFKRVAGVIESMRNEEKGNYWGREGVM